MIIVWNIVLAVTVTFIAIPACPVAEGHRCTHMSSFAVFGISTSERLFNKCVVQLEYSVLLDLFGNGSRIFAELYTNRSE